MNNFGKILFFASAMMFMAGCGVTERDAQITEASFSLQETSVAMEETETSVAVQEPQEMTAAMQEAWEMSAAFQEEQDVFGEWTIDGQITQERLKEYASLRDMFGSGFSSYGSQMSLSSDRTCEYSIGINRGGRGTWNWQDGYIEAELDSEGYSYGMEDSSEDTIILTPVTIEGKDCLAMEFDGEVLYWEKELVRPESGAVPAENYEELIAAARECAVNQNSEIQLTYDFSTALLASYNHGTLGYLKKDLDGDGTEELLIGANDTGADGMPCTVLYHLYTISGEEPVSVLKGWERNRYYLCENGMIANEGSSGAADSEYSYFVYQGAELKLQEAVFYDGERDKENPWFYAAEPSGDAGSAQPISEEEAEEIRNRYVYQALSLIPFEDETSTQTEEPVFEEMEGEP